ncbi:MAG: MFS transporter, partial [Caulobacter sp. 39-67-4]
RQQITMSTLPPPMVKNASGLVNLARNTGGAMGLALLATSITQQTALYYSDMTSKLSHTSGEAQAMIAGLTARMTQMGVADPEGASLKAMSQMIERNATVLAFGDSFTLLAIGCFGAAFVSLLARPAAVSAPPPSDAH